MNFLRCKINNAVLKNNFQQNHEEVRQILSITPLRFSINKIFADKHAPFVDRPPPSHQQSPKISAARVAPEFCLIFYANDSRDACCYDSLNSRNGNGPGIYLSRVFAFLVCAAQIAGKATHQEITAYRTSSPPSFAYQSISVSIVVESTNIRRPS